MRKNWQILGDLSILAATLIFVASAVSLLPRSSYLKGAHAQSTFLGPNATSVALATTSAQIIGTNPSRKGLQFCNPTSIVEYIAPVPIVPVTGGGTGIGLPAISSGVTSCFTAPQGLPIGAAWNGVSASSTPNITVLEYP